MKRFGQNNNSVINQAKKINYVQKKLKQFAQNNNSVINQAKNQKIIKKDLFFSKKIETVCAK